VQLCPFTAADVKYVVVLWDPLQDPIEVEVVLQLAQLSTLEAGPQESPLKPLFVK
jgi:hypothetical protein